MAERITWAADTELAELLQRYYQGEAEHWPAIQARVHAELQTRAVAVGPRHLSFRRTATGYLVIAESAEDHSAY